MASSNIKLRILWLIASNSVALYELVNGMKEAMVLRTNIHQNNRFVLRQQLPVLSKKHLDLHAYC